MNLNKHREFFDPEQFDDAIHIIGCGAVGSTIAEQLARLGAIPSVFEISEPIMFGFPVVLNPTLSIPFILIPSFIFYFVIYKLSYLSTVI